MKNQLKTYLKSLFTVAFSFIFLLNNVTLVYAETRTDAEVSNTQQYAIDLLNSLRIYEGVEPVIGSEDFVRRDAFAFLLARIAGMENAEYFGSELYDDVQKDSFAYNAINNLTELGVISGYGNNKFKPTSYITLDEATILILKLMGYGNFTDLQNESEYKRCVSSQNFHRGIVRALDKRLQVKQLTLLLYNALTADIPQMVSIGTYRLVPGETLLSATFRVFETEGVITANEITSFDIGGKLKKGMVRIGNKEFLVGNTDAAKYIGYKVKAYYSDEDGNSELFCIDTEKYNNEVTMQYEDLNFTGMTYTYSPNGKSRKQYTISPSANVIYNGRTIYFNSTKMVPAYGAVTIIDNDSDSKYDTVIIKDIRNAVVHSYSPVNNSIIAKYGATSVDLSKYDEGNVNIHKPDGKGVKVTTLKEWTVLAVCESDDGEYIEIIVLNEETNGTVNGMSTSDAGNPILNIGASKYEVAPSYNTSGSYDITVDFCGTFYLDIFGRIAAADGKILDYKWGYATNCKYSSKDDAFKIKILNQDSGAIDAFYTSAKLFIDDVKYTSNTPPLAVPQVIRYKMDKEGRIRRIYTVGGGNLVLLNGNISRGYKGNQFMDEIAMDSNTVILQIPRTTGTTAISYSDDINDESLYSVMTVSDLKTDSWYYVSAYGITSKDIISPCIVLERGISASTTPGDIPVLITKIYVGLNSDGEAVDIITGYQKDAMVEFFTPSTGYAAAQGIEKGDLYSFQTLPDGTICTAIYIYDKATDRLNSNFNGRAFNESVSAKMGYAYNSEGVYLQVSTNTSTLVSPKIYRTNSAKISIWDSDDDKNPVKVGSISDIQSYCHSGQASRVVVWSRNQVPEFIISYQ
ncbi:MAG: S-layer homology domain-containing protein [Firmicutes bacterium]|nr:S-layer homology domain-containing protein [Bacillota bacterium]